MFLCWYSIFDSKGQDNLVLNPSFEDTLTAYDNSHLYLCNDWIVPTAVSSDWFSTDPFALCNFCCCTTQSITTNFGNESPVSGNAIIGLVLYTDPAIPDGFGQYKEYIEGSMSQSLVANNTYQITINLSLADSSKFAINRFGMYFSDEIIDLWSEGNFSTSELNLQPQVMFSDNTYFLQTDEWTTLESSYTAIGGEKYFILGSFDSNEIMVPLVVNEAAQSLGFYSHYFFDEVSITRDSTSTVLENYQSLKISVNDGCIKFSKKINGSFEIYDLNGKLENTIAISEQFECFNELVAGLYILNIKDANGIVAKRSLLRID